MKVVSLPSSARYRGFTLIELLSVALILSALLMVGVSTVRAYQLRQQAMGAAHEVLVALEHARTEAIRRNTTVRLSMVTSIHDDCELNSAGPHILVSRAIPAGKCGAEPETAEPYIVKVGTVDTDVRKMSVSARGHDGTPQHSIAFNAFGWVIVNGGQWISEIDVRSPPASDKILRVTISPVGEIRMCDPTVNAADLRSCKT